jgi:hypothetical protein
MKAQARGFRETIMRSYSRRDAIKLLTTTAAGAAGAAAGSGLILPTDALAQGARPQRFTSRELLDSGHQFFGAVSRGLASVVEEASRRWGQPNAYILGQEAGGAFVAGARFGEGVMYTRNAGDMRLYWQGPSIGFDAGADGARTMMLVYNLPSRNAIYRRFGGIDGSAYFVGGFGFTALTADDIVVAPIRAGVGARLGVNLGYLKFTETSTWNPF